MSGCQCMCRRRFLRTLFTVGGTVGLFYLGTRIYKEKVIFKEMDEIIEEGEAIAKKYNLQKWKETRVE